MRVRDKPIIMVQSATDIPMFSLLLLTAIVNIRAKTPKIPSEVKRGPKIASARGQNKSYLQINMM